MNYNLIVIFVFLVVGPVALSDEGKNKAVTMTMVVEKAAFGDYDEAVELLASIRQSNEYERQLISKAETAVRLAAVADRLDPWEGSDFGRATPWYTAEDAWKTDAVKRKLDQSYFDSIIAHSIKRLEALAKSQGK